MLAELDIRDLVVIDRLTISFEPGLNVLTGETGAGKSILLDALGLALGWRGRANLVREGAEKGEVTAVFEVASDHPAMALLQEAGFESEDGQIILRRTAAPDGRKTAYINDRRASGEVLRRLGDALVELHGQHDDRGLMNARGHRALLDDFGDLAGMRDTCRSAWRDLRDATGALEAHEARVIELQKEEDFLRHAAGELDKLNPQAGEEEDLDTRRRLMQAGARVGQDVARAAAALGIEGAEGTLRDATRWIEDAGSELGDDAAPALDALSRAMTELGEAAAEVDRLSDRLKIDPGALEQVEERLFALRALARKHGVLVDDLPALAAEFQTRIGALDSAGNASAELEDALANARKAYEKSADRLTAARAKAAKALDKAMAGELAPLKMDRARFEATVTKTEPGPDGQDAVAFLVSTNPGLPPGPLQKIASGGELSRFMLAMKVSLTRGQAAATMIFDEIDRGVGGATADAVGRRLARLGGEGQVLVVTHSPQVAALGSHHWLVSKEVKKSTAISRVAALGQDARIDEIARMLSGDTVTDAARAAARELLTK